MINRILRISPMPRAPLDRSPVSVCGRGPANFKRLLRGGKGRDQGDRRAVSGVREGEALGMELQAGRGRNRLRRAVETIAEDRMADRRHMDAKLVRPPSLGIEREQAGAAARFQPLPAGQRGAAVGMVDLLHWPVRPVGKEREVHFTFYLNNIS